MEGAGGSVYTDFKPFSKEEIDSYIGLLLANSLILKPQIDMWFNNLA